MIGTPCDATVARLVGYENVLDAVVDERGDVRVGGAVVLRGSGPHPGRPCSPPGPRAWSSALNAPARPAFRVERVRPGQGRWQVELRGAAPLTAHLPWETAPPAVGDAVSVSAGASAVVIPHGTSPPSLVALAPGR